MGWKLAGVGAMLGVTVGALGATTARAQVTEIYKCYDENGRPLYTSDKRDTRGKKCELVSREVNVVPSQPARKAAPRESPGERFPRESSSDRQSAKERQRQILEKELATEQQLLSKAQKDLADQEAIRTGDERNYARVLERLQPYRDSVETHQKNIEALRRELTNLER
jgi:hypothetical protein